MNLTAFVLCVLGSVFVGYIIGVLHMVNLEARSKQRDGEFEG